MEKPVDGEGRLDQPFPRQQTVNLACPSLYLGIEIAGEDSFLAQLSFQDTILLIKQAIKKQLGVVGGAVDFKALCSQRSPRMTVIIKVDKTDLARIWSSLSSATVDCNGQLCNLKVVAVSPFLLSLGGHCRVWAAKLPFPR